MLALLLPSIALGADLTPEEQAYLRRHGPVTMCVDPDWPPFERINEQGKHEGIAADLALIVSERTGVRFELTPTASWDESLEASKAGRCQVLSFLNQTPTRQEWLIFSEPIFTDSNVFITREEHPFIADPAALSGETIVFPKGTAMEELIRKDYPNLSVLTTETENEAIAMVSAKKADMTMRSLIIAAYTIKKEGLFNLKIAGQLPNYTNKLRLGIVKGEPMLKDIINKGIASITGQERALIANRHVSINVQTATDYKLIIKIVAVFAFLAAIGFYWTFRLRRLNAELKRLTQTDTLTGLANRSWIIARFHEEFSRAVRYERPFSILMLDIDHFKAVNDELGHLMGDKVLTAVARVAKESIRNSDSIGRWGGEEFLALCPETDQQGALQLARRICDAVRSAKFESGRTHTVSIGVATLSKGDNIDALLHRADTAMYQAKKTGRDRACAL